MTKRILALLLALLLPVAALAETCCLEASVQINQENAPDVFKAMGLFAGANNEDDLCQSLAEMVDGFAIRVVTQEDANRFTMAFDDTNLLEMSVIASGADLVITSELLGSNALLIPADLMSPEDAAFVQLMEGTDWLQLLGGVVSAAAAHLDGFEVTTQRGSFSGDAYAGGVYCTTCTFDDADIAALLSAAMTDEVRELILAVAEYLGFDGEGFIAGIEQAHQDASAANTHHYIVRVVYDAAYAPIGLSATVLAGEKQLATLSVGYADGELLIVAGLPMDDVNFWHCHGISLTKTTDEDGAIHLALEGSIVEFTGLKDEDFAFAAAVFEETLYELDWSAQINLVGDNAAWSFESVQGTDVATGSGMTAKGFLLGGTRFSNTCSYSFGGKVYMTERITWAPCDPISTDLSGYTLCDVMAAEDAGLLNEMGADLTTELTTRLLKVVPMQLLLYLQ
ncbi:MAG: hypothetical protein IJE07_14860 [Clostridia bacterium]|nr:hypothetical protein [Clostridia bacterium]